MHPRPDLNRRVWNCCHCNSGGHLDWQDYCASCHARRCHNCLVYETHPSSETIDQKRPIKSGEDTRTAHPITTVWRTPSNKSQVQADPLHEAYIAVTAEIVFRQISAKIPRSNLDVVKKLCARLPYLLHSLAIRLVIHPPLSPKDDYHDFSSFISQNRRIIINRIQTICAARAPSWGSARTVQLESVELEDRLRRYETTVTTSIAGKWWLRKVDFELSSERPGLAPGFDKTFKTAAERILQKLCQVKSWRSPISVFLRLEWNPLAFYEQQGFDIEFDEFVAQAVVLVGTEEYAHCTTVSDYLHQCWPDFANKILAALRSREETCRCDIAETPCDLHLQVYSSSSPFIRFLVHGTLDWIAELGDAMTWLGSALRASQNGEIMYCTSSVNVVACDSAPRTDMVSWNIYCSFEQKSSTETSAKVNGRCWHDMFLNSVVATGYPIRVSDVEGLELSLPLMATMTGATHVTKFRNGIFLKGFSSMLVLTRRTESTCQWHHLSNHDCTRIRYTDPRVRDIVCESLSWESMNDYDSIRSMRHVIGWCREVQWLMGSSKANYDIGRAPTAKKTSECVVDRVTISAGYRVTVSASAALGRKAKPVYSRHSHHTTRLRDIHERIFILYDVEDHRPWLIDGASALLHLVHASLKMDNDDGIPHDSAHDVQQRAMDEGNSTSYECSLRILRNDAFLGTKLYKNPDEVEEVTEETVTEVIVTEGTTTAETEDEGAVIEVTSGNRKSTVTRKTATNTKKTWYCIKDRVDELCSTLEQIVEHQENIDCQDGFGFQVRRSSREQLAGFQFREVAQNISTFHSGLVNLLPEGNSWVDFSRAIQAITLYGNGFGDLLKPVDATKICKSYTRAPKNRDCLVVPTEILCKMINKFAEDAGVSALRLVDNTLWYPSESLFPSCPCTSGQECQQRYDPVQVLVPRTWQEKIFPSKSKSPKLTEQLKASGALIFGKSKRIPLQWGTSANEDPEWDQLDSHMTGFCRGRSPGADIVFRHPNTEVNRSHLSRPDETASEQMDGPKMPQNGKKQRPSRFLEAVTRPLKKARN
ncbi:hypothetical protein BKA63DRAFT_27957 [Paraphoma chrysanthemicola]|nr:hypothetical protein BKA63DRAFT_27957 [Paraphoma chrysanthemicola]